MEAWLGVFQEEFLVAFATWLVKNEESNLYSLVLSISTVYSILLKLMDLGMNFHFCLGFFLLQVSMISCCVL